MLLDKFATTQHLVTDFQLLLRIKLREDGMPMVRLTKSSSDAIHHRNLIR